MASHDVPISHVVNHHQQLLVEEGVTCSHHQLTFEGMKQGQESLIGEDFREGKATSLGSKLRRGLVNLISLPFLTIPF
uniref:Uncharacterized protein n=1 Tax=Oryza rufipogon TaxID=4529 RepID=A0A0E0Q5P2_ORYRU